jgi:hypothetical protein
MISKASLHLLANAVILWLGYYWLGIAESRALTLTGSIVVALFVVVLATWTYAASFLYRDRPSAFQAWRASLSNIGSLILIALVLALIYWLLARWAAYSVKTVLTVASFLTLKLRVPVRPASVGRVFNTVLWLVRWMIVPVIFVPLLKAVAERGWRGSGAIRMRPSSWIYWIEVPVLLYCFLKVPLLLLSWVPPLEGFIWQSASFALRAVVAYLLFGAAWLTLAFVTSAGTPRETQPSTVVSP